MILPREIRPFLEELEPLVEKWPVETRFQQVIDWLLQFEPGDYDIGARVIRHLNVIGPREIRTGFEIVYSRLRRRALERKSEIKKGNTVFASIGDLGKSGAMMAYEFRIANELPEGNFAEDQYDVYFQAGIVENFVLIDDVLGTGNTAVREAKRVIEETASLGVKNVFVVAICGFEDALRSIEEEAGAHAIAAYTYNSLDTASKPDGDFYKGLDYAKSTQYQERLKHYNQRCSRSDMGYGNIGALIAFPHNTPNVTLPIVWGSGNGWKPLFARVGRIPGIENYYAKFESEQRSEKEKHQEELAQPSVRDLTILVEGKTDELIFDTIFNLNDVSQKLGVDSITVVSVGGSIGSEKMLELLKENGKPFVLVLEDDRFAQGNIQKYQHAGIPFILLKPNIIGLFNLEKVFNYTGYQPNPEVLSLDSKDNLWIRSEQVLKKQGFGRSPVITSDFISFFIDDDKLISFVKDLKRAIKQ